MVMPEPKAEAMNSPRILVVDDEVLVRKALGRLLKDAGYECSYAADVAEALDWLKVKHFDLMLCDICMPGRSGLDLVRDAREEWPEVTAIVLTGMDDPKVGEAATEIGVHGFLTKPFRPSEVLVMVSAALKHRDRDQQRTAHKTRLERQLVARTLELNKTTGEVDQLRGDLRVSQSVMITTLAKAAELRDVESAEHIKRVSRYCGLIAQKLGLPAKRVDEIQLASMLHDVGKIAIPDAILLKPGKLTEEEFAVMKGHAELGERMLRGSNSRLLDLAARIAVSHHERFDGSGYPARLSGEEIPLEGRIAAVADVYDAMTTRRVYKDPISVEETVEYLTQERGKHFDPQVVDVFLEALDEVLAIQAAYAEHGQEVNWPTRKAAAGQAQPTNG